MRHNLLAVFVLGTAVMTFGCTPRVRVRQSPGPKDTGIRYYRPKPYLRIEPASSVVTEGKKTTATPSDEFVAITIEYLPDFSEEYSIEVCPGLGSANVTVGLTDGWNLTSVNQTLDSQFDENVKAVADLAKAASGFIPTNGFAEGPPQGSPQKFVVAATNVPIGYYESVISKDACGKKRLYGWRYIGFLPYSSCPIEMCGSQHLACQGVPSELFGIVFDHGVMKFKRLDTISDGEDETRVSISTGQFVISATTQSKLDALVKAVKKAILQNDGTESDVNAKLVDDRMSVDLSISLLGPIDEDTTRDEFIKDLVSHEDVENALVNLGDRIPSIVNLDGLPSGQAGVEPPLGR
jgi:hypothetical protein